jgi:hypothetical protein
MAFCVIMCSLVFGLCSCAPDPFAVKAASYRPAAAPLKTAARSGPFSRGSTFETVEATMGHPEITQSKAGGLVVWNYKFSTVTFKNGRVVHWNNVSKNLRFAGEGETGENIASSESNSAGDGSASLMSPEMAGSISSRSVPPIQSGQTSSSVQTVQGYQRADGVTVPTYVRTRADSSSSNNYSSGGNVNAYTGKRGSR